MYTNEKKEVQCHDGVTRLFPPKTNMCRWQNYDITTEVLMNLACNTASEELIAHIVLIAAIAL
jgi:hypothetical protein